MWKNWEKDHTTPTDSATWNNIWLFTSKCSHNILAQANACWYMSKFVPAASAFEAVGNAALFSMSDCLAPKQLDFGQGYTLWIGRSWIPHWPTIPGRFCYTSQSHTSLNLSRSWWYLCSSCLHKYGLELWNNSSSSPTQIDGDYCPQKAHFYTWRLAFQVPEGLGPLHILQHSPRHR